MPSELRPTMCLEGGVISSLIQLFIIYPPVHTYIPCGVELRGTNSSQISSFMPSEELLYLKSVFLSLLSFERESSSIVFVLF